MDYLVHTQLQHWGIKGMKWGVRRYQNEDGSLTDAGRRRQSNKAARMYYKIESDKKKQSKEKNFQEYQKQGTKINKQIAKLDLKTAGISKKEIEAGRYRISRNRELRRTAIGAITGTAIGAAAIASGMIAVGIPAAAIGYGTTKLATGGYYYKKQRKAYKTK